VSARGRRRAGARRWRVRGDAAANGPVAVAAVHGDRAAKPRRTVRAPGGAGLVERDGAEGRRRRRGGACAELAEAVAGEVQDGDGYGDWVYCGGVQEAEAALLEVVCGNWGFGCGFGCD